MRKKKYVIFFWYFPVAEENIYIYIYIYIYMCVCVCVCVCVCEKKRKKKKVQKLEWVGLLPNRVTIQWEIVL